jgi:hypothetical protein
MTHGDAYRGYVPHIEFGDVVWYRTTATTVIGRSMTTGKEIRAPKAMNRVVTNTSDIEEAKRQLDRKLDEPKKLSDPRDPNQQSMF